MQRRTETEADQAASEHELGRTATKDITTVANRMPRWTRTRLLTSILCLQTLAIAPSAPARAAQDTDPAKPAQDTDPAKPAQDTDPGQVAQPPDPDTAVRTLLNRSSALTDARVVVPLEVWKAYLKAQDPDATDQAAPIPCVLERGSYLLEAPDHGPATLHATLEVRIFDPGDCSDVPILSNRPAWDAIEQHGASPLAAPFSLVSQGAILVEQDGWYRLHALETGVVTIDARVRLPLEATGENHYQIPIAHTVRTQVALASSDAWRLDLGDDAGALEGGTDRPYGQRSLSPRDQLDLRLTPPRVPYERPARFEIRGALVWTLREVDRLAEADLDLSILGATADTFRLELPSGAERVSVTGPDIREVHSYEGGVNVFLRGQLEGTTRVRVSYGLPHASGNLQRLQAPRVEGGRWTGGTVVVTDTMGNREVLLENAEGLRPLSPAQVPARARALLESRPSLVFAVTGRQFFATVDAIDLGSFALEEAIADQAHYQVLLREDGALMYQIRYEVRNRVRQFMRLYLPQGAQVLSARVNEQLVPVSREPESPDTYRLPLVRSTSSVKGLVSFPVELVFVTRTLPIGRRGRLALSLPRVDLPIAYAWCEAYLPEGISLKDWAGPLEQVDHYARDTANERLGYGRAVLAEPSVEARIALEAQAAPRNSRLGLLPGHLMMPAASPKPAAQLSPPPPPEAAQNALAANYYRSGKTSYEQGDLENASESLRRAIEIGGESASVEMDNARLLLDNVRLARGELELTSRSEKAAGAQVKSELEASYRSLEVEQERLVEKGLEASRKGEVDDARAYLQAADKMGETLMAQGQDEQVQALRMEQARVTLATIEEEDLRRAGDLEAKLAKLKREERYDEALETAQTLSKYTRGSSQETTDAEDSLTELSLLSVQSRHARRRSSLASKGKKEVRPDRDAPKRPDDDGRVTPTPQTSRPEPSRSRSSSRPPSPPTRTARTYDIRGLVDDSGVDEVAARVQSLSDALNGGSAPEIEVHGGQLEVVDTPEFHEAVADLLETLETARGPRVEFGETLARQKAAGILSDSDLPGGAEGENPADLKVNSELSGFLARNYGGIQADEVVKQLARNLGQTVDVTSTTLDLPAARATALGARFVEDGDGLRYAVVDEAQLRTLVEIDASARGGSTRPWQVQETVVGTDALLADQHTAHLSFASEQDNTLYVDGNAIQLPHGRYLVLDRGGSMTAIGAGALRHWTQAPERVPRVVISQDIEVPRSGQLFRFEKTLVKQTDNLIVTAVYKNKRRSR